MEISDIYSEVYEILNILGNEYINKMPQKLYKHIEDNRNIKNMKEFDINIPIEEQDLSKEALEFIAYLNLQYWCDKDTQQNLIKIYKENDANYEKKLREKYNVDNLLKNREKEKNEAKKITEYKTPNFLQKILEKIKRIFRKNI